MRVIPAILALLLQTFLSPGPAPVHGGGAVTWTHAGQCTPASIASGTTVACTLSGTPATGNVVAVYINNGSTPIATGVSDGTNNYTGAGDSAGTITSGACSTSQAATAGTACLAYLICVSSCGTTITATFSGCSGTCVIFADYFSVSGGSAIFDNKIAGSGTTGTAINTPTVTPTGTDFLYVGGTGDHAITAITGTWLAGAAITSGVQAEYLLNQTSGVAAGFTQSSTGAWDTMGMSFK